MDGMVQWDEQVATNQHFPLACEVEWYQRNLFAVDILPHIQFSPVGKQKDAVPGPDRCACCRSQNSGRSFFGSHCPNESRREKILSFAAIFLIAAGSPMAASKLLMASASNKALVLSSAQQRDVPNLKGLALSFTASVLVWTMSLTPNSGRCCRERPASRET